jgi:hypothetical protein
MLKRNLARLVATLSLLMLVGSADAKANGHDMDDDDGIVGTWLCSAIRAGTVLRPIIWQFRGDGTFDYASGTTVNTDNSPPPPTARSPVYKSGFAGRGGGHGEWGRGEDHDVFTYHSVEILHNDRATAPASSTSRPPPSSPRTGSCAAAGPASVRTTRPPSASAGSSSPGASTAPSSARTSSSPPGPTPASCATG